jgi:hypothetical protein
LAPPQYEARAQNQEPFFFLFDFAFFFAMAVFLGVGVKFGRVGSSRGFDRS